MTCYNLQAQDSLQVVPLFPGNTSTMLHPLLSPDGQYLYLAREHFTRNLGPEDASDIWVSWRQQNSWMPLVHLGYPVNDFTANYPAGIGLNREWIATLKRTDDSIYVKGYRQAGRRWVNEWSALPALTDSTQYWFDWQISHDQQVLFFCASAGPGYPADIFITRRLRNRGWSLPERLPSPINSPYHEATAFMAADARGLYFSSDRPGGEGGQDLLYSEALNTSYSAWTSPQYLEPPINSPDNDMDASIAVADQPFIFVRSRGDTTQVYQGTLPAFARPQSVSLISVQLVANPTVDSLALVIFPLARPPMQRIIPKTSQSEEQLVLTSGQAYAVYARTNAPLFSPSKIINLSQTSPGQLDYSTYPDTSNLKKNRVYQQRADIIRNLQQQLQVLDRDISRLFSRQEQMMKNLQQLQFPPLPNGTLNRNDPEIRTIERTYDQARKQAANQDTTRFSGSEYNLFVNAPGLDTSSAETARERLDRLRQRFSLRQEEGYVSDTPLSAAKLDSLERQAQQPPDFRMFLDDLVRRFQAEFFPEVLEDVVQRSIPVALQRVRAQAQENELFILNRDQEKLPTMLRDLDMPISPTDTSMIRPLASWQKTFLPMLSDRLRSTVRPLMRSTMNEPVRRYFIGALTYYLKQERKVILEESLGQQIEKQITDEAQSEGWSERLTAPPTPFGVHKPSAEVRVSLRLAHARREHPVELKAMLFRANQATFLAAAIPDLQRIIDYLQQHTAQHVHIAVHTHQNLTHTFARKVTRQRAQQIRQYLERAGIAPERIHTAAMGRSRPKTWGSTPDDLAQNQRVEIYFFAEN